MKSTNMSRSERVKIICDWIDRMTQRYGGVVIDKTTGQRLDWGQALARECYGVDWDEVTPDVPTEDDIRVAMQWERGEWPDWAEIEERCNHECKTHIP